MPGSLVIKKWKANGNAKPKGTPVVSIEGRHPGIMAFLLNLCGLSPTTTLEVTEDAVYFSGATRGIEVTRVIPMNKVAAVFYGFEKPIAYLVLAVLTLPTVVLPIVFLIGYVLNKSLTIAVVDQAGFECAIAFKPSVIEGNKIDKAECDRVTSMLAQLALAGRS